MQSLLPVSSGLALHCIVLPSLLFSGSFYRCSRNSSNENITIFIQLNSLFRLFLLSSFLLFSYIFLWLLCSCVSHPLSEARLESCQEPQVLRTSILSVFHNIQFLTATSYDEIYKILLRFLPLQSTLSVLPNIIGRHGLPVWRSWMLQL